MTWESALGSAIEVAIGIAGFSGIVAAVGRRGAGNWNEVDQLRLLILLTASGVSLLFAFLPFVLIDLMEPALVWRLASGLLGSYFVGIVTYRVRAAAGIGGARAIGMTPIRMTLQAVVVSVLFANAFWFASPSLYVVGVLWGLAIAFLSFVGLLLDSGRQPPDPSPPAA